MLSMVSLASIGMVAVLLLENGAILLVAQERHHVEQNGQTFSKQVLPAHVVESL